MRTCTICRPAPLACTKAWATGDQQDRRVETGSEIRCCPRAFGADTTGQGQRRRFGQQSKGSGGVSLHNIAVGPPTNILRRSRVLSVLYLSGSEARARSRRQAHFLPPRRGDRSQKNKAARTGTRTAPSASAPWPGRHGCGRYCWGARTCGRPPATRSHRRTLREGGGGVTAGGRLH